MKLATFTTGGAPELGVVEGDSIISLSKAAPRLATDMIDLVSRWADAKADVERIVAKAAPTPLAGVRLLAPIPRPGKIMAIGLNYADHVKETGREPPKQQIWFGKMQSAVNGPYDPIQLPKSSNMVDWEAELVFVVGKQGKYISKADAASHVFGYCCGNDISVRDWQNMTPQWILGKSFDTHAPFGPWIVTADEIPDPHALGIRCFVNGERRQNSNTSNLIFNIYDQIALLSQAMTLYPGDVIFTGTPGGVGMALEPPVYLKGGDKVRIEIDKIGAIEASMVPEA
ncbi:MAG TPA: fumarylacetoacetate hydrolase family protein [Rhizomicrobium sp.]|nr:fumarylacetoacetate hydrolase family protein [Rhizomicrobium sp.]